MALVSWRRCDLSTCNRVILGRVVELRMVVTVDEVDGRHHEHDLRMEACSQGCALTGAKAVIERGFA